MHGYFLRQLQPYVEYHRDPRNGAMHVVGIIFLFLGATLPLTAVPVTVVGVQTTLAVLLSLPVLLYWLLLDVALGLAIVAAAVVLLSVAALIVGHTGTAAMWTICAVLIALGLGSQAIGHQVFEGRAPSIKDNPSHILLGPMFVMAKLFIALGFRDDLAAIIQSSPQASGRAVDKSAR